MFRKNTSHLQQSLFGIAEQLAQAKLKKLQASKEYAFYREVFCRIKEEDFAGLYSDISSRPNAPVNCLVASILLMYGHNWTTEDLFNRIDFDLLTRAALGLETLDETPFCPATFFNFQNRLLGHFTQTGENLLERVFDGLTEQQLKLLKVKTDIQRCDSFMAMSNIRSYSRLQLLVEMLIRLHRVLDEQDKGRFEQELAGYVKQSSGQYIYRLDRGQIPHEMENLGRLYQQLYEGLKERYGQVDVFRIFERVYTEHFTVVQEKVTVRPSKELTGGSLQSPDDIDATYRLKNGRGYRGQSVNVTETANPGNEVNLITDAAVCSNVTDDSEILNRRLDDLKDKTPQLNELHTDGAYGSQGNDEKMEGLGITHVQTAVRGRKAEVSMEIEQSGEGQYTVKCPHQTVGSSKTRKRYKACFDADICERCCLAGGCPSIKDSRGRTFYFERSDFLLSRRSRNRDALPARRRGLRANVEATVKEFTKPFNHKGKLRVRGLFKTMMYAFSMAICINFGRLWRYVTENGDVFAPLGSICVLPIGLLGRYRYHILREVVIRRRILYCLYARRSFARAA